MFSPWVTLILMLMVSGALVCGVGVLLTARAILRPPRMTDGKALAVLGRLSPADLGLEYDVCDFTVVDQRGGGPLRIAGWWMPARVSSGKTAVLIHGYADAKVGSIAWAPTWHGLGWNVLAIDLRAHGESGGVETTGGYFERHDVWQVVNQLRILKPNQTARLALFGASLGAAVAVATAAMREDVDAIVLDSPITDYRDAVLAHGRLVGSAMFLMPAAIRLAEWMSRADFDAVRSIDGIRQIKCPVLAVLSGRDALVSEGRMLELTHAIHSRDGQTPDAAHGSGSGASGSLDCVWRVDGVEHLQALAGEPQEYVRNLRAYLDSIV